MLRLNVELKYVWMGIQQFILFQEYMKILINFSEGVATIKRGKTQFISIDVINPTKNPIILKKGTFVGSVHSVSAVISLKIPGEEMYSSENWDLGHSGLVNAETLEMEKGGEKWLPKADLSYLNDRQKKEVEDLF